MRPTALVVLALLSVGCEGERGPVGPQGPAGSDGVDGTGLVAYYQWWSNEPVPSDEYTVELAGYVPKGIQQVGVFCAYGATQSVGGFGGWEELPFLIRNSSGDPVWASAAFNWDTGEANLVSCSGAYVYCQAFVFEPPHPGE